ncbi:MAG: hypothetical protein WCC22_20800 [Terriglobales bacterium]
MTDIMYLPVSRVLSPVEIQLFAYLGSEREAVVLARYIVALPEHASLDMIEQAVISAMVACKESRDGRAQIEYVGGQNFQYRRKGGNQ